MTLYYHRLYTRIYALALPRRHHSKKRYNKPSVRNIGRNLYGSHRAFNRPQGTRKYPLRKNHSIPTIRGSARKLLANDTASPCFIAKQALVCCQKKRS